MQELFSSAKYKFKNEEDCYQLIITGPKVEDTGKYTIEISGVSSTGFLNVDGKQIYFFFILDLILHREHHPSLPIMF
jgi:hypothetical protein